MPAALAAFWLGYRQHRTLRPALLGVTGVGCLVDAFLAGFGESTEIWITTAGSLLLVAGHTMNWRLRTRAV